MPGWNFGRQVPVEQQNQGNAPLILPPAHGLLALADAARILGQSDPNHGRQMNHSPSPPQWSTQLSASQILRQEDDLVANDFQFSSWVYEIKCHMQESPTGDGLLFLPASKVDQTHWSRMRSDTREIFTWTLYCPRISTCRREYTKPLFGMIEAAERYSWECFVDWYAKLDAVLDKEIKERWNLRPEVDETVPFGGFHALLCLIALSDRLDRAATRAPNEEARINASNAMTRLRYLVGKLLSEYDDETPINSDQFLAQLATDRLRQPTGLAHEYRPYDPQAHLQKHINHHHPHHPHRVNNESVDSNETVRSGQTTPASEPVRQVATPDDALPLPHYGSMGDAEMQDSQMTGMEPEGLKWTTSQGSSSMSGGSSSTLDDGSPSEKHQPQGAITSKKGKGKEPCSRRTQAEKQRAVRLEKDGFPSRTPCSHCSKAGVKDKSCCRVATNPGDRDEDGKPTGFACMKCRLTKTRCSFATFGKELVQNGVDEGQAQSTEVLAEIDRASDLVNLEGLTTVWKVVFAKQALLNASP